MLLQQWVKENRQKRMETLLRAGLDVHIKGTTMASNVSLLSVAARHRLRGMVRLLLKYGANPATPLRRNSTALHFAVSFGDEAAVNLLIEAVPAGRERFLVSTKTDSGVTPFHLAAQYATPGVLKRLVSTGGVPDVNIPLPDGTTPLLLAARAVQEAVKNEIEAKTRKASIAEEKGKPTEPDRTPFPFMLYERSAETDLTLATRKRVTAEARYREVYSYGADPTIPGPEGRTPEAVFQEALDLLEKSKTDDERTLEALKEAFDELDAEGFDIDAWAAEVRF